MSINFSHFISNMHEQDRKVALIGSRVVQGASAVGMVALAVATTVSVVATQIFPILSIFAFVLLHEIFAMSSSAISMLDRNPVQGGAAILEELINPDHSLNQLVKNTWVIKPLLKLASDVVRA